MDDDNSMRMGLWAPSNDDERLEERPIDGKLVKQVPCRGFHSSVCVKTERGWYCDSDCRVVDLPVTPVMQKVHDHLIRVDRHMARARKKILLLSIPTRIHWQLVRVSARDTYHNGRCEAKDQVCREKVWYEGRAWTRRGARNQMNEKALDPSVPEHVQAGFKKLSETSRLGA